jgi:hypothetical protein
MGCTIRIQTSKNGSNDARNRKILVFQPNFITFDQHIVFVFLGMAGAAGGLSLPRQMATDC